MTVSKLRFELIHPGQPIPASRPRMGKGHGFHAPAYEAYLEELRWAVKLATDHQRRDYAETYPLEGEVAVTMRFYRRTARRVDIDNLAKAGLDALTGFVIADDSQVAQLSLGRYLSDPEPRIEIAVSV